MWDSLLGPDPVPPPTNEERRQLRRILNRRRLTWLWLVTVIPAVYVTSLIPGVEDPFKVGYVWIIGFAASAIWNGFFTPCPRCGEQFTGKWYWGNPWTQRCMNCGMPLQPPPAPRDAN
jgi:hypothetical protein